MDNHDLADMENAEFCQRAMEFMTTLQEADECDRRGDRDTAVTMAREAGAQFEALDRWVTEQGGQRFSERARRLLTGGAEALNQRLDRIAKGLPFTDADGESLGRIALSMPLEPTYRLSGWAVKWWKPTEGHGILTPFALQPPQVEGFIARGGPVLGAHDRSHVIGRCENAYPDPDIGIWVWITLAADDSVAERWWRNAENKRFNGLSASYKVPPPTEWIILAPDIHLLGTPTRLAEVSLAPIPANLYTRFVLGWHDPIPPKHIKPLGETAESLADRRTRQAYVASVWRNLPKDRKRQARRVAGGLNLNCLDGDRKSFRPT